MTEQESENVEIPQVKTLAYIDDNHIINFDLIGIVKFFYVIYAFL